MLFTEKLQITPQQPTIHGEVSAPVTDIQSLSPVDEAVYYSPGETPNPVVNRRLLDTDRHARFGDSWTEIFTMKNGRRYEVVTNVPRKQRSEVPIVFTTALGTSIRGHNWHTMQQMMDTGFSVVMVGPEGGHASWPHSKRGWKQFMHNLTNISLEETAENMHEILNVTDHLYLYEPGGAINIGESRGGGAGMGFKARASRFGRQVLYSDLTATPFAKKLALLESPKLSNVPVKELKSIGRVFLRGKVDLVRLTHYPETLNLNPHYLLHVAGSIPTLLRGHSGNLADEIGQDAKMHNTQFEEDGMGQASEWDEKFKHHPYVVNLLLAGTHVDLAQDWVLDARVARMRGLRDELETAKGQWARIDWRNVHMGEHIVRAA
ncbi:MAG: hypothetical protein JWS12_700 [Candidatus Saccharibacteria bacterium]|nr:hypothetical protein [Candidatus Saccharibacteria bacterium]